MKRALTSHDPRDIGWNYSGVEWLALNPQRHARSTVGGQKTMLRFQLQKRAEHSSEDIAVAVIIERQPAHVARCSPGGSSLVLSMRTILALLCVAFFGPMLRGENLNALILEQVRKMPRGGRYSTSHFATIKLQSVAHFESGKFLVIPTAPYPSFCSGATYLVFVKTLEALRERDELQLDFATLNQLVIRDQHDGEGVWGRWNANGPGTARLFYELGLGRNFTDFAQAQPGDFMKIFWSKNVGRRESGHSVIFLGLSARPDGEYVRFWSSNLPGGYGEKEVPRTKVAAAIFSRLMNPENLSRIHSVPATDAYLASLLRKRSSLAEATKKCGI